MENYEYRQATKADLERRWDINIANNPGDDRWVIWKTGVIELNQKGMCKMFVVLHNDEPIGEGTLLFSPVCGAISGRLQLADNLTTANINGLRIDKPYEGKRHISRLVKTMEQYANEKGYHTLTIGVEACETRNLAIYLHWGYNQFISHAVEDGELVLYYAKKLS